MTKRPNDRVLHALCRLAPIILRFPSKRKKEKNAKRHRCRRLVDAARAPCRAETAQHQLINSGMCVVPPYSRLVSARPKLIRKNWLLFTIRSSLRSAAPPLERKEAPQFPLEPPFAYKSMLSRAHARIETRPYVRGATTRGVKTPSSGCEASCRDNQNIRIFDPRAPTLSVRGPRLLRSDRDKDKRNYDT